MTAPRIVRRDVPAHGPWPDSVPPVLQRVYAARGLHDAAQAELKLAKLLSPDTLGHVDAAAALLQATIAAGRQVVVIGDFDCDGATGTAVAVRGLRLLGAPHVDWRVPHRQRHGYGLSPALVAELPLADGGLLLTVDSGIACQAGVLAAKAVGWQVLVSDHHLPGPTLPAADAIVNPNVDGDPFPSKALAGVGVVFYLLLALRRRLRDAGAFATTPEPDLSTLLDLVAVGTVADLVPLDANNRLLVAAGLRRLREGRGQPGLVALARVAGRDLAALSSSDIGFAIGPRLNAAGRLEDMTVGIECLLTDNPARAFELAQVLERINAERRDLQQRMTDDAEALLDTLVAPGAGVPAALCVHDRSWHAGIVGLVASRLKDRCHRPVLAFAPAETGSDVLKGSGRSIPGLHLRDVLAAVDARHPGLVERFGGHAMAAGLSLPAANLPAFCDAFVAQAAAVLDPALLRAEIESDGALAPEDFTRALADTLRLAGPWGQGFPEPLFDGEFDVVDWRAVGGRHLKLSLRVPGRPQPVPAIQFGGWQGQPRPARIRAAFQLDTDDWQDRRGIQLLLRHWEPA